MERSVGADSDAGWDGDPGGNVGCPGIELLRDVLELDI
jgi:hypothetical protein